MYQSRCWLLAAGYHERRERGDLQAVLLHHMVQVDPVQWVRVFPDPFFVELYRLYQPDLQQGRERVSELGDEIVHIDMTHALGSTQIRDLGDL
jgi:hypothetical protein